MDSTHSQPEAIALDALATCHQPTRMIGDTPALVLPEGFSVENVEKMLTAPTRKRGTTVLNDAESFIAVVNDQKNASTRLYSTINPPTFTAVFNHHAATPGWGDHKAEYHAPLSPEWKAWTTANKRQTNQLEMAAFLEANMVDVAYIAKAEATADRPAEVGSPDGATLLEICRTLEAKKKVNFKSSVRLSDGSTQFTYDEDVSGSAVKGTLAIPDQFSIGIPVFENGDKYRVDVRFRYRISDGGALTMWLELVREHKVIEDAVKQLRAKIAEKTALTVLNGKPSA